MSVIGRATTKSYRHRILDLLSNSKQSFTNNIRKGSLHDEICLSRIRSLHKTKRSLYPSVNDTFLKYKEFGLSPISTKLLSSYKGFLKTGTTKRFVSNSRYNGRVGQTTLNITKMNSKFACSCQPNRFFSTSKKKLTVDNREQISLQSPAGALYDQNENQPVYIPQVPLHSKDGRRRKRVLVLCTGGTLTMAPDPNNSKSGLRPVQGSLTQYMNEMKELENENMPEVVTHEYTPLLDSSDLGPAEWAVLAQDIKTNYHYFDGFVVLMGTDTMAYTATALSFMLENLGKPVVFTGSQIPLREPYNDARRNLIMALIFASRDSICEVLIFFHDRLLRACRSTKVNTHNLMAFDSPNLDPLATIGISIKENESLIRPHAKGALRVHTELETRIISLRLVPGYEDNMIRHMIDSATESNLKALVICLYGTGNLPSLKHSIIDCVHDATKKGILVVASTQCQSGSVMMGHYATGRALKEVGVVSGSDMTLEAVSCKIGYLMGRGDLTTEEVGTLMSVSLRGEVTPEEALPPTPLSSDYQIGIRKGKTYY